MDPWILLHYCLNGLAHTTCVFLLASGLSLIYGMSRVLNLAHGALFMVGAYVTYECVRQTGNFWLTLVLAPALVGAIGLLVERFLLRRVEGRVYSDNLLLTFGLLFVLSDLIRVVWGVQWRTVSEADILTGAVPIFGQAYPVYNLFHIGAGTIVFIGLTLFLRLTRWGQMIRAAATEPDLAAGLGLPVPRLKSFVFGLGASLAGLMGALHGPLINVNLSMGHRYLMDAIAVVVI
ncbi:MAG: branched-chain amino acid ABC transporter permease, partial [Proteobacteria bacterium]|nr:branched-chain amino acid ABC transporter permease [Pseudomonadota bacterium]